MPQHIAARASHARNQTDRKPRADHVAHTDHPARTDRAHRPDHPAHTDHTQRADRPARAERPARSDRSARTDRADHPARTDRARREDRPTRGDRLARADQADQARRADRPVGSDQAAEAERKPRHRKAAAASGSFADLGLPEPLLRVLAEGGITTPFPIQSVTLPDALAGRDVLGRAQTGSGKTLAFGLALLTRLTSGKAIPLRPRALVLVPTRELALQVSEALMPLAKSLGLWCRTAVGGMSFARQEHALRCGVDLLIATPGRLSDHVRQGTCDLSEVRFTAIDEADQMADMGFLPQVRAILDLTPADGQRMLFSATLDGDVDTLVKQYLTDPVTHSVAPVTASVDTMDHHLLLVSKQDKPAVVAEVAARDGRTIMFVRTKHHVDRLTSKLRAVGVLAGALHGGKTQGARNRVLDSFRGGEIPVLVATDVAARGIHVDGISLVVHVDPPADAKDYLHRAGRTARAGESGTVVTLVTHEEQRTVSRLTEKAGVSAERTKVRPGHADLARITGARQPSGEPVVEPKPAARPPRTGHAKDDRFRRGRPQHRRPRVRAAS